MVYRGTYSLYTLSPILDGIGHNDDVLSYYLFY